MADAYDASKLPAVTVPAGPVKVIKPEALRTLATKLSQTFSTYKNDRKDAELQWVKNLRQYLGVYDPEIEAQLSPERSKAYPRLTRVKCISVLARIMNLMFPGNERNWELKASPSAEMDPEHVREAVAKQQARAQEMGLDPTITPEMVQDAVQVLADERAAMASRLIDDQLQELGGDQTLDHIALNRKVIQSGIMYGTGVLRGPFVRETKRKTWQATQNAMMGTTSYTPIEQVTYKPQFEFLPIWDFYPDMSAKTFRQMDGYFLRLVMSKGQVRKLADRADFLGDKIKQYLAGEGRTGNYKAQPFEQDLKNLSVSSNVNDQKADTNKYEIIVWYGVVDGAVLKDCGCDVKDDNLADDLEAEVWMIGDCVIKVQINAWRMLGMEVSTLHTFSFDEDDTSIFGNGLPAVVRDSQMSINAATRMMLDNAGVICGPMLEFNLDKLLATQDLTKISAHKIFYTRADGPDAQYPAIRNIQIDSHLDELMKIVDMFMRFMDIETFVGPATGGEMDKGPSEPFRTAAGASMLRGEAALPFKDIIRNYDTFTQSVIYSLVQFNRKFNPDKVPEGDYDVIARGATSLIAKEIKGIQLDAMAQTLQPEDFEEIDRRKFLEARMATRDLNDMLLPPDEAKRRRAQKEQMQAEQFTKQSEQINAAIRKELASAFKDIAQGQKNLAAADKTYVDAANTVLEPIIGEEADDGPSKPAKKRSASGR